MFERIEDGDRSAAPDCLAEYGSFIWALSKKFTRSIEEAEAATFEIFTDIWRYRRNCEAASISEQHVVAQVARRRLIMTIREASNDSNDYLLPHFTKGRTSKGS